MNIPDNMFPHILKIFGGEYNVGFNHTNPIILDIGANVGGFAIWASMRWPNSTITCFEPLSKTFDILQQNTRELPNIRIFKVGIGLKDEDRFLYYGKNNIGEASLFKTPDQEDDGEIVSIYSGCKLQPCNIMKIDTEGAEIEILSTYKHSPEILLIEYHSEANRLEIDAMLKDRYVLIASNANRPNYGIVKYMIKNLK